MSVNENTIWIVRTDERCLKGFSEKPFRVKDSDGNKDWGITSIKGVPIFGFNFDECIYLEPSWFPNLKVGDEPIEVTLFINESNNKKHPTKCYDCKKEFEYSDKDIVDGVWVICPDCGNRICILDD